MTTCHDVIFYSQDADLTAMYGLMELGRGYFLSGPVSVEVVKEVRSDSQPLDSLTTGCANLTGIILFC